MSDLKAGHSANMARRNETVSKVHFKGKDEDFIMFVEDEESVNKWKKDRSVPLAQVVSGFKVFVTNKHGAQGLMNEASKAQLEVMTLPSQSHKL